MDIQRIAAFSHDGKGGNPAGVVLLDSTVPDADMARVAAKVGYSETVFAVQNGDSTSDWRARYFSPETEVPFCGHATIAFGAVLGELYGAGTYNRTLNEAVISVEAEATENGMAVTLTSPPTLSQAATEEEIADALALFDLTTRDLDGRLPPARIQGGVNHVLLVLNDREKLATIGYDLDQGRNVMRRHGVVTIMLAFIEDERPFVVRNAFASGGVLEDPATGASAAAFAGYLRDRRWSHRGHFVIRQGEDMGVPSLINVSLTNELGAPVKVGGKARVIVDHN